MKLKARLRGQTFKKERVDEPTMRVTGTFRGVSEELAGVTVIVPWYVPATRPDVCTETVRLPGVVPGAEPRTSQLPPVVVLAVAVKATPGVVLVTDSFCAVDPAVEPSPPPVGAVNCKSLGATVKDDCVPELTISATGMVSGLPVAPAEAMTIDPL